MLQQLKNEKVHWKAKSFTKEREKMGKKLIDTNSQDSCKEKDETKEESCEKSEI